MQLTADELIQPVSEDLPCGEDLEYDPAFQQMETLMQSKPEQEFGDTIIPGEGPDWKGVNQQVNELLPRTRDLRVLVYGSLADLHLTGLSAFSESLESLNACLETFWASVYPELDVEDNNDPTMRFNVLQMLNDRELVLNGLENAPLVVLPGLGAFSMRDIELAEGKAQPVGEEEVHDLALIQGAFGDANAEDLTALGEGVGGSMAQLKRLAELWDQLSGDAPALNVDDTLEVLNHIHTAIGTYAPVAAAAVDGGDASQGEGGGAAAVQAAPLSGAIASRTDVVNAIDKICEYYVANEPSSPVPLVLRRAQRLVTKSFSEILQDIAPDSITQLHMISGGPDE